MDDTEPWFESTVIAIVAALVLVTPTFSTRVGADDEDDRIEIVRDPYGVPHVYGETAETVTTLER